MHPSALRTAEKFVEHYGSYIPEKGLVLDVGSQDVNGSLREVLDIAMRYVGVDFVPGKNVDVVLDDPYALPFGEGTAAAVLTSSCMEHSEMFWLLFNEMARVLAPGGLLYLNAPSNGVFHRYPVDCWRFYPDSGAALAAWATRSGHEMHLLESFIGPEEGWIWNDFVAVFQKAPISIPALGKLAQSRSGSENIRIHGSAALKNHKEAPWDKRVRWALEELDADATSEVVSQLTREASASPRADS